MLWVLQLRSKLGFAINGDPLWFDQRLDHFNVRNQETFKQRYWENNTFADRNDPKIIVYLGGEAELTSRSVGDSMQNRLAQDVRAFLYGLEHRYYGKSYPEQCSILSPQNLTYLSLEQALSDIASFITERRAADCNGTACPVLVIGGSYIGMASSFFRMKYPHLANFSWASSPPLLIKNSFSEYDRHVAETITDFNPQCFANAKAITQYTEDVVYHKAENMTRYNEMMARLNLTNTPEQSHSDASVMSIIADFFAGIVQYESSTHMLTEFCSKQHGDTPDINAFYDTFIHLCNMTDSPSDTQDDLWLPINASSTDDAADHISWLWQTCTEFGWYQTADHDGLRSKYVDLDYSRAVCERTFGLKELAEEDDINNRYGNVHPEVSNIVYTNGKVDPWSTLSLIDGTDLLAQRYTFYIEGASHCADLSLEKPTDSHDLKVKRQEILRIVTDWIGSSCEKKCDHGACHQHKCVCDKDYRGEFCDRKVIGAHIYKVFLSITVALPTILMITIGLAAWFLFRKDRDFHEIHTLN